MILVSSAIYCCFSIYKSVLNYFEFEVITNIDSKFTLPIEFPAVTICNSNQNITLDDMLIECHFNVENCTFEDFYLNVRGGGFKCYTFNMGKDFFGNSRKIKKSNGLEYLKVDIFIGYLDTVDQSEAGLLVSIHNHTNNPSSNSFFLVQTGK